MYTSRAWDLGYQAYKDGVSYDDNPYDEFLDAGDHYEWKFGWQRAAEDD